MTPRRRDDIYAAPDVRVKAPPSSQSARRAPGFDSQPVKLKPSRRSRGFDFAENGRFTGDFSTATLTADQAVFYAITTTRNRARELEKTHPLIRKFLTMIKDGVVGASALRFKSRAADLLKGKLVPDSGARGMIERAYADFSRRKNFSLDHRLGRRRFMRMVLVRMIVDGEVFIRKLRAADNPHKFTNQILDADLVDHRLNTDEDANGYRIIMGVKVVAKTHRPISYFFRPQAVGPYAGVVSSPIPGEHIEVPAEEIIHFYEPERPGQTRGLTYLAPAGMRAKLLDGLETAVLVGYRVAAAKMGFLSPDQNYDGDDIDIEDVPTEVSPGQLDLLPKGVNFHAFDPAYPDADYDAIKTTVSREIGSALGVSHPELSNNYSGVSFSSGQLSRHADEALYASLRALLVECAEAEIFEDWLTAQLLFGILPFPLKRKKKFLAHKFFPPRRRPIDVLKDAKGKEIRLSIGDLDPYEMAAEGGEDLEDRLDNLERAIKECNDRNLPIPPSWLGGRLNDPLTDALLIEPEEKEPPAQP